MIQAPRGTFDVLPQDAERRELLEAQAKRILEAAGYRRIETPSFEATELFARGVGEATDIVQKEMYTFDDGGGRSLTLRPEGTAPVCRAYIEHGMHKLPQPVKLWYLSSFFRAEAPQRGRYRQFWQVGAEAIGAPGPDTDAELIVLLAELLHAMSVKDVRLRLASLGTPETRSEYRRELSAYLRAHEHQLSREVRARLELNPMRAFDATDAETRAVMLGAPKLLDRLAAEDAEHFSQLRRLLDEAGITYEHDPAPVRVWYAADSRPEATRGRSSTGDSARESASQTVATLVRLPAAATTAQSVCSPRRATSAGTRARSGCAPASRAGAARAL